MVVRSEARTTKRELTSAQRSEDHKRTNSYISNCAQPGAKHQAVKAGAKHQAAPGPKLRRCAAFQ